MNTKTASGSDEWFANWLAKQSLAFRLRFVMYTRRDWFETYIMMPLGMWLLHSGKEEKE
jgi:hypothetical protein